MGEYFGPGDASMSIFLDDVECEGDERSIELCSHSDWLVHNCDHKEDAAVICRHADDIQDETTTVTSTLPSTTTVSTQPPIPSTEGSGKFLFSIYNTTASIYIMYLFCSITCLIWNVSVDICFYIS